jgi:hypothetical protein
MCLRFGGSRDGKCIAIGDICTYRKLQTLLKVCVSNLRYSPLVKPLEGKRRATSVICTNLELNLHRVEGQ